jgi:hypothetical protein
MESMADQLKSLMDVKGKTAKAAKAAKADSLKGVLSLRSGSNEQSFAAVGSEEHKKDTQQQVVNEPLVPAQGVLNNPKKKNYDKLSDELLLDELRAHWGFDGDSITVWGELQKLGHFSNSFIRLIKVRSVKDNLLLSYPGNDNRITLKGIHIPKGHVDDLYESGVRLVKCDAVLAQKYDRQKQNNPFLVGVKKGTVVTLKEIDVSFESEVLANGNSSLVSDAIYEHFINSKSAEVAAACSAIEANKTWLIGELKTTAEKSKLAKNKHLVMLDNIARLKEAMSDLSLKEKEYTEHISTLLERRNEMEIEMANNMTRFRRFIEAKATILKDFEFIDEHEFDSLFCSHDQKKPVRTESVDFAKDLHGEYPEAVSYIQAHLMAQDILYPRHVIENFFSLIRTNDLIVLAGDSGSGKTNLVESFAKAIGGVSKVIPVKPNWTSSEDLLGYYNPLEKKYLATPFLEALIEATNNPDVPYLICLDEMNLARVEYYFADFLSKLEQRGEAPQIQLYSDVESAHVLSELNNVLEIIESVKEKYNKNNVVNFVKLLQDPELNAEIKRSFGFSEKDSLIKYHSDLRRMVAGVISTPSLITFPANVRIIGAINIDETTHYLSPKILDRAHVMKFKSPLLTDWQKISDEVEGYHIEDASKPLSVTIDELGARKPYPKFHHDNDFCKLFVDINRNYFSPLGVEFGMRTIRQGLNYMEIFSEFNPSYDAAVNNFMLHKVLPKFTFDGNKEVGDVKKFDLLFGLSEKLKGVIDFDQIDDDFSSSLELGEVLTRAQANDWIVNYWS